MTLTYHDSGSSGTQLTVFSGTLAIAIFWKSKPTAAKREDWRWTFTVTAGPTGFQHYGKAATKDHAVARIEDNWREWLDAAALSAR